MLKNRILLLIWSILLFSIFTNATTYHVKTDGNKTEIGINGITRPQGVSIDIDAYELSQDCDAEFYADKKSGQPALSVQFYDASDGAPDHWAWDFQGDGIIDSNEQNPLFVYQTPGLYTVTLTISKGIQEDTETKMGFIYVAKRFYVSLNGKDENNGLSWNSAYRTITKAISTVSAHDEVWIAAGCYQEKTTIEVPIYVSIYGGFSGEEIDLTERNVKLDQVIIDGNNSHRCLYNSGTLDGLYIRKGKSTDNNGSGIYNKYGTVFNCTAYDNTAADYGSGIYNYSGSVTNCTAYGNTATKKGGGIYNYSGSVTNCTAYGNTAEHGGGIYNSTYGTVTNCAVYNNTANGDSSNGGGIYNSSGTVNECTVYDNTTNGYYSNGGGIYNNSVLGIVTNCEVYTNTATDYGGGIYNDFGTVTNCSIYNNRARARGGIVNNSGTVTNCIIYGNTAGGISNSGTVSNCIIWANLSEDIYCGTSSPGTVNYSCYGTGINVLGSNNIINSDPLFTNTSGERSTWDFHLQSGSLCIDAGTSTNAPETDIEGTTRPQGNGIDMGAHEFSQDCKAVFYADKRFGKPDLSVQFHDASYGNPDNWSWDFQGDGVIDSYESSPLFVYQAPGYYTVTLTVSKGMQEYTETKIGYICVGNRYYVSFDGNNENNGLSWDSAYQTITKAMSTVSAYDEVWIAVGNYQEGARIAVPRDVAVYGGFSGTEINLTERSVELNHVIIDGNDNHRCLYNLGTLDGLYVKNGKSDAEGGGIENRTGSVTNCTVYDT